MTRSMLRGIGVTVFAICLAAFVTWPHVMHLSTSIFSHHDPYFSIWRLAWVAHALATSPRHLFDANIFYPATGTLAYSDATLLEGVLAAPFFAVSVTTGLATPATLEAMKARTPAGFPGVNRSCGLSASSSSTWP